MKSLILIVVLIASFNSYAKIKGLSGGSNEGFVGSLEIDENFQNSSILDEQCSDAIEVSPEKGLQIDFKKLEELNCKLELKKSN